ncbi:hypothetical protein BSL84_29920 [Streptomyces sp. TN58]|nr:hypothetical protein BSL84_29920 [Streptomyces sp. TN58]
MLSQGWGAALLACFELTNGNKPGPAPATGLAVLRVSDGRESLSAAPGERHEYSNANYMLLGALLEEVTGKPFGQQLRENVLKPLGMDGALTNSEEAERATLAPGTGSSSVSRRSSTSGTTPRVCRTAIWAPP